MWIHVFNPEDIIILCSFQSYLYKESRAGFITTAYSSNDSLVGPNML